MLAKRIQEALGLVSALLMILWFFHIWSFTNNEILIIAMINTLNVIIYIK